MQVLQVCLAGLVSVVVLQTRMRAPSPQAGVRQRQQQVVVVVTQKMSRGHTPTWLCASASGTPTKNGCWGRGCPTCCSQVLAHIGAVLHWRQRAGWVCGRLGKWLCVLLAEGCGNGLMGWQQTTPGPAVSACMLQSGCCPEQARAATSSLLLLLGVCVCRQQEPGRSC
jgi:hypothetical protein